MKYICKKITSILATSTIAIFSIISFSSSDKITKNFSEYTASTNTVFKNYLKNSEPLYTNIKTSPTLGGGMEKMDQHQWGKIFQDSKGTIYILGGLGQNPNKKAPQFMSLKKGSNKWIDEKTKNSNIDDGYAGFIFEDSKHNLWAAGKGTPLQVKWNNTDTWEEAKHQNNLLDGLWSNIIEDSNGNIWTSGKNAPLQVLRKGKDQWEPAGNGNNIKNAYHGLIFESSIGDIYAQSSKGVLEVLKKDSNKWTIPTGLPTSTIDPNDIGVGFVYEDSKHNLWHASSAAHKLFVKKANQTNWVVENNNIEIAKPLASLKAARMFEDSNHDLYFLSAGEKMQVLRNKSTKWEFVKHNNNITSGQWGFIFEDSKHNLWAAGEGTSLQVKLNNTDIWIDQPLLGGPDTDNRSPQQGGDGAQLYEVDGQVWASPPTWHKKNNIQIWNGKDKWVSWIEQDQMGKTFEDYKSKIQDSIKNPTKQNSLKTFLQTILKDKTFIESKDILKNKAKNQLTEKISQLLLLENNNNYTNKISYSIDEKGNFNLELVTNANDKVLTSYESTISALYQFNFKYKKELISNHNSLYIGIATALGIGILSTVIIIIKIYKKNKK